MTALICKPGITMRKRRIPSIQTDIAKIPDDLCKTVNPWHQPLWLYTLKVGISKNVGLKAELKKFTGKQQGFSLFFTPQQLYYCLGVTYTVACMCGGHFSPTTFICVPEDQTQIIRLVQQASLPTEPPCLPRLLLFNATEGSPGCQAWVSSFSNHPKPFSSAKHYIEG